MNELMPRLTTEAKKPYAKPMPTEVTARPDAPVAGYKPESISAGSVDELKKKVQREDDKLQKAKLFGEDGKKNDGSDDPGTEALERYLRTNPQSRMSEEHLAELKRIAKGGDGAELSGGQDGEPATEQEKEALDELRRKEAQLRSERKPESELLDLAARKINAPTDDPRYGEARRYFDQLQMYARMLHWNATDADGGMLTEHKNNLATQTVSIGGRTISKVAFLDEFASFDPQAEALNLETIVAYTNVLMNAETGINVKQYYETMSSFNEQEQEDPKSFEDLVKLIMITQKARWRRGGKDQLMNEKGEVVMENFLAWVRSRIYFHHDFSPDSSINLFQLIAIPTRFRSVTLSDLLFTDKYFGKKTRLISGEPTHVQRDNEGRVIRVQEENTRVESDTQYDRMQRQLLYEVWLFGESHNNNAAYKKAMGVDEELLKTFQQMYGDDVFSRDRKRLLHMLKLPTVNRKEVVHDILEQENQTEQGSVGKGVRKAILAYYHMGEASFGIDSKVEDGRLVIKEGNMHTRKGENMFNDVLNANYEGNKGVELFYETMSKEVLSDQFRDYVNEMKRQYELNHKGKPDVDDFELWDTDKEEDWVVKDPVTNENVTHRSSAKAEFLQRIKTAFPDDPLLNYDSMGGQSDIQQYALQLLYKFKHIEPKDLNIFRDTHTDQFIIDTVQKGIRKTLQEINGQEVMGSEDARYAEQFAYSMTYWTGINARNDTDLSAHDRWSVFQHTKEYRLKQASTRMGVQGEMETFPGIKRVGLNFWEGLRVQRQGPNEVSKGAYDLTLLSFMQGSESGIDLNKWSEMEFIGRAEKKFFEDHIREGWAFLNFIQKGHGFHIEQYTKIDPNGRLVIDPDKVDSLRTLYKNIRYAYNNSRLLYGQEIRDWDKVQDKKNEAGIVTRKLRFETKKMEEAMFGDELREMGMYHRFKDTHGHPVHGHPNEDMSRNILGWMVAMDLAHHRNFYGMNEFWGFEQVEQYQQFWNSIPIDVEEGKDGHFKKTNSFFDHHEWKKISKMGDANIGKLFLEELGYFLVVGTFGALVETAEEAGEAFDVKMGHRGGGGHH